MYTQLVKIRNNREGATAPSATRRNVVRARREREKQQRAEDILQAAKKVFFSKGYLKATMDEIAYAAEISKPTIYQYFKTKDDLYFTLMLPVVEDIGRHLELVEGDLDKGLITEGRVLIDRIFAAVYHSYELSPDTFRIVQAFQQQGLVMELRETTREGLNDKGRSNFRLCRRLLSRGMDLGLIKRVNSYELTDLIWGTTVGVIQLEDIKLDDQQGDRFKRSTLKMASNFVVAALQPEEQP